MRKIGLGLLLGLFVAAGPAAVARQAGGDNPDVAAIRDVIQRVQTANNAGDVDAWVALFAPDAVYMASNLPPVTTREGLLGVARTGFVNKADIRITPDEIEVCDGWAFARNHVTGSIKLQSNGSTIPVDVKQIVIYKKQPGGEWKISRLISNSNLE